MKALAQQPVNSGVKSSNEATEQPQLKGDRLWAHLRRISARIDVLESAMSVLKRDFARWERREYREAEKSIKPSEKFELTDKGEDLIARVRKAGGL